MDEKTVASAMEIILHAGDARVKCKEALKAVAAADFAAARERMREASAEITEAHRVQTDAIQGEASGESVGYSLLFTHAQDTLMTVNSEINMSKQLIGVFEAYEARISALEARLAEND